MVRRQKLERHPGLRWMIRPDVADVMEIERRSFQFPWDEAELLTCLKQRNCIGTVYESSQGCIYGFMVYELHKDMLQIINLAVAPEARLTGVGRAMVQRLIDKLSNQRRRFIEAEVRETNLNAQLFFSAAGFRAVETLRKHYDETDEDAILFRYTLPKSQRKSGSDFHDHRNWD